MAHFAWHEDSDCSDRIFMDEDSQHAQHERFGGGGGGEGGEKGEGTPIFQGGGKAGGGPGHGGGGEKQLSPVD
jgi:hypothetical protein